MASSSQVVELSSTDWSIAAERRRPEVTLTPKRRTLVELNLHGAMLAASALAFCAVEDWQAGAGQVILLCQFMSVIYLASLLRFAHYHGKAVTISIVFWAMLLRLVLAVDPGGHTQLLSNDVYRYLWEGKVVDAGHNPYLQGPLDPTLAALRDAEPTLWQNIEHKQLPAVYPAGAQFLFLLLPRDLNSYRLAVVGFEVVTLAVLALWIGLHHLPAGFLLYYAWLPLAGIEVASNAHLEALFLPLLVLGLYLVDRSRHVSGLLVAIYCLSIAVAIKYVAIVPLLFLIHYKLFQRREHPALLIPALAIPTLVIGILQLPFIKHESFAGLEHFAANFKFNSTLFRALEWGLASLVPSAPLPAAAWVCVGVLLSAWGFFLSQQSFNLSERTSYFFLGLLVLSPVVYPWYLLWFAPLLVMLRNSELRFLLAVFCCTMLLSYEVLAHPALWELSIGLTLLVYLPVAAVFCLASFSFFGLRQPSDWPSPEKQQG